MRHVILTIAFVAAFGLGGIFVEPPGGEAQAQSQNREWAKCVLDHIDGIGGGGQSSGAALLNRACLAMTR